jgi:hypothetical protein
MLSDLVIFYKITPKNRLLIPITHSLSTLYQKIMKNATHVKNLVNFGDTVISFFAVEFTSDFSNHQEPIL